MSSQRVINGGVKVKKGGRRVFTKIKIWRMYAYIFDISKHTNYENI